ncbi:MAG: hypothetical protein OIN66_00150 [Candidatus Methanoperedens sp.]|nr:hypothetical protein [Candidatus Methanoperedens sp.]
MKYKSGGRRCAIRIVGVTALALILLAGSAGAAPSEEWNKTFGGSGDDIAYSVQQTSDGGYVVAGYTNSYGAGDDDACLIKTDGNGNEVWNRTFGGSSFDRALSVQQTSDGGFVLSGETYSYGGEGYNAWIIKTDANGSEQWNRTLKGRHASSIQQTSDSGYIITGGSSFSLSGPPFTIWLVKTDENGNELWNRTFESGKGDFVNSVRQTSYGGYIVAGGYYSYWGTAAWIIKTDTYGNQQWSKTFLGKGCPEAPVPPAKPVPPVKGSTMANAIQQTLDGGYIIAGYIEVYSNCNGEVLLRDSEVLLIKTDENGNEQWNKTFGGDYEDKASSAWQVTDGGYIISGSKCLIKAEQCNEWLGNKCISGVVRCDAWLIKTDANGNEQWNKTFEGIERETFTSIQQTRDGGYIIAGTTNSYGSGGRDAWLIKVDGASIEIAEAPTGSPTETLAANPTQALTTVPTGTNTVKSFEKAAGFEVVLAIAILLAVYIAGRKMK